MFIGKILGAQEYQAQHEHTNCFIKDVEQSYNQNSLVWRPNKSVSDNISFVMTSQKLFITVFEVFVHLNVFRGLIAFLFFSV